MEQVDLDEDVDEADYDEQDEEYWCAENFRDGPAALKFLRQSDASDRSPQRKPGDAAPADGDAPVPDAAGKKSADASPLPTASAPVAGTTPTSSRVGCGGLSRILG
ncbi:hypothetical protein CLOM_g13510 [Closterium sp. NIES-68]|nr:hypothetical protein CLOM_g13510 [Closterium sp. NIES-68]